MKTYVKIYLNYFGYGIEDVIMCEVCENARAVFALCQDADEEKMNVARIVPVMQREGVQQAHAKPCIVYQDRERMSVS